MTVQIISLVLMFLLSSISIIIHYKIFKNNRRDKYKLFLIEKRMEVYQRTYKYSKRFINFIHTKDKIRDGFINEVTDFYNKNCLLIEPDIRQLFRDRLNKLCQYRNELDAYCDLKKRGEQDQKKEEQYKKVMNDFGDINTLSEKIEEIFDSEFYLL